MIDPQEQEKINAMAAEVMRELRAVTRRAFWIKCVNTTALIVSLLVYFWWVL